MAQDKFTDGAEDFIIRAEYVYAGPDNERLPLTLDFPTSEDAVARLLENAGINGVDERVFFAESYESPIHGLAEALDDMAGGIHPDELNTLAKRLGGMDERGRGLFAAALELHRHGCDTEGLSSLASRLSWDPELRKAPKKRSLEGYEELFSVKLDGVVEIMAVNPSADKPYMLCDAARDNPLGVEEYRNGIISDDYLEIMREFTRRLNVRLDSLELGRVYRGSPTTDYPLTAADCVPGGMDADLNGKIVVIKPESLSPEYRSLSFQLAIATGGFGCEPNARGRAVYCTELYSGEKSRWNRSDILGVASEGILPAWAKEKRAALAGKPPQRESVMKRIREAKTQPKPPHKPKSRGKPEQEL
jgi:hypothetical protein